VPPTTIFPAMTTPVQHERSALALIFGERTIVHAVRRASSLVVGTFHR
jgi:hypothetical protein